MRSNTICTVFIFRIGFYFSCAMSTEFMLTEKMEGILDRSMTAGKNRMKINYCYDSLVFVKTSLNEF